MLLTDLIYSQSRHCIGLRTSEAHASSNPRCYDRTGRSRGDADTQGRSTEPTVLQSACITTLCTRHIFLRVS